MRFDIQWRTARTGALLQTTLLRSSITLRHVDKDLWMEIISSLEWFGMLGCIWTLSSETLWMSHSLEPPYNSSVIRYYGNSPTGLTSSLQREFTVPSPNTTYKMLPQACEIPATSTQFSSFHQDHRSRHRDTRGLTTHRPPTSSGISLTSQPLR